MMIKTEDIRSVALKSYIAILISLLVALAPISGTAQETQGQRGIAVAKKTPTAVRFTGTPTLVAQLGNAGSDSGFERGALSPDGNYALTSDGDLDAVLWDVSSGRQLRRFVGNSDPYVFLPDNTGAVMTLGATAVLLDIQTGSEMRRFEKEPSEISPIAKKRWGGEPFALRSMAVSPDGKKLLVLYSMMNPKCQSNCGDDVSEVVLFDVETGEELNRFNESGRPLLLSIALSPDGRRVLVGGKNSRATLWDAESGTQLRTFDMGKEYVNDVDVVRFSPDGTRVLMALSAWDSKKKERGYCYKANNGSPGITGPCTTVWDTETGEQLQRFPFVSSSFSFKNDDVWFSPDGRYVVHSYPFTMYDVNTGALVRRTEESRRALDHSLVDNKILLLGDGEDKSSMVLWDLQSGQVAQNFKSRGATSINSVSWSRDGRMILIGDANKAYLWDLAAGKLVQQYAEPLETLSLARPRGNYYDWFATPVERAVLSPDAVRVLT
ncbi:MAG: WD40 repeat domain-containing protein, partial [Candidatus Zixiibacteriota bacterium]